MASIRLCVRSKVEGQLAPLWLRFRDHSTDFYSIKPEKVFPEYWNNDSQSFRQRILFNDQFSEQDKFYLEEKFSNLKNAVLKNMVQQKGIDFTRDWLDSVVDKFYNKKEPGSETPAQYIRWFIVESANGTRLLENVSGITEFFGYNIKKSRQVFHMMN
jgi:hypothetical protein